MPQIPSSLAPLCPSHEGRLPNTAIFLSGSGSNAEQLLKVLQSLEQPLLNVKALVTDNPTGSRAREIGALYHIPVLECDIRAFYRERGETRVSILTPRGQEIREEWTNQLRKLIAPLELDFAVFAGFVPLTNLTKELKCLNVHPGDLTYLKNGERLLVGLHTLPIERAILEGLDYLRSSVIVVEPYGGAGAGMDSGALLGISGKVMIDFCGSTREELIQCAAQRPAQRPKGGWNDRLEEVAKHNQNLLKEHGDWVVLPQAVLAFATGKYATDAAGNLYCDSKKITTIEFCEDGSSHLVD